MPRLAARVFAAVLVAVFCGAFPLRAEIEKILNHCPDQQKLCPFFRASVTVPDGWVEDKEATRHFNAIILVPKGVEFNDAKAVIYALALFNRDKQPISTFLPDAVDDWKSRAKDGKITNQPDLSRGAGKAAFIRRTFEAPSLAEQGYEHQAVTADGDKDGNQFIVTITLSANSRDALLAAEPAYLAVLGKY
jgi:hypothetical protein